MRAKTLLMLVALVAGFASLVVPAEDASAKEKKCPVKRTVDCGGEYGTPPSTVQPDPRGWFTPEIQEIVGYRWTGQRGHLTNIVTYPDQNGGCTISGERLRTERPGFGCKTIKNTDTGQMWRVVIQRTGGDSTKFSRPVCLYEIQRDGAYHLVRDFRSGDTQIAEEPKSPPSKPPVGKSGGDAGGGVLGDAIENGVRGIEKGIREKLKGFPKLP